MVFLLAMLALNQMSVLVAQAGEPALPKLKTETQGAFERYVKLAEARNEGELKRGTGLLWVDGLSGEQRADAYAALKRGEVKMQKLEILDGNKPIACPGGMIHHWTGVVFIPAAKLEDVQGVFADYDRDTEHEVHYLHVAPGKADSRSSAVRIAEVENAGESEEREKTLRDEDGFMWQ